MLNLAASELFDGESEFDSVSTATVKAWNGGLTYGNYHTSTDTTTNKEIPPGITFPVRVSDEKNLGKAVLNPLKLIWFQRIFFVLNKPTVRNIIP